MKKFIFISTLTLVLVILSGCLTENNEEDIVKQADRTYKLLTEEFTLLNEEFSTKNVTTDGYIFGSEIGFPSIVYSSSDEVFIKRFNLRNSLFKDQFKKNETNVSKLKLKYYVIDSKYSYNEYNKLFSSSEGESEKEVIEIYSPLGAYGELKKDQIIIVGVFEYTTQENQITELNYSDAAKDRLMNSTKENKIFIRTFYGDGYVSESDESYSFARTEVIDISNLSDFNIEDIRNSFLKDFKNELGLGEKEFLTQKENEIILKKNGKSVSISSSDIIPNSEVFRRGSENNTLENIIAEFKTYKRSTSLKLVYKKYFIPSYLEEKNYYDLFYDAREKEKKSREIENKIENSESLEERSNLFKDLNKIIKID